VSQAEHAFSSCREKDVTRSRANVNKLLRTGQEVIFGIGGLCRYAQTPCSAVAEVIDAAFMSSPGVGFTACHQCTIHANRPFSARSIVIAGIR
jgi:hypothetical protein